MKLSSYFTRTSAEVAWTDFIQWIGFSNLVESVERKQRSLEDWSAFKDDIAPRLFSIENGFALTIRRWRSTRKLSYPRDKATYDAYSFIGACTEIKRYLSPDQARRFRRRIISEILPNGRLCHLDHEIRTAQNLTEFEWEIIHYGFCGDPGPDFIARRNGVEIEVESKCLSPEIGLGLSYEFCARILSRLSHVIQSRYSNRLTTLRVEFLSASSSAGNTAEIERLILNSYNSGTNISTDSIRIRVEFSSLNEFFKKFPDVNAGDWLQTTFTAIRTRKGDYGYFIRREEELIFCNLIPFKENQQIKKIHRLISSTCDRQFSKQRPALLWLHLQGLEPNQINDPSWSSAFLGRIARHSLRSPRRDHVMSLVFTSDSELDHDRMNFYGQNARHVTAIGHVKGFDNLKCRFDPINILAPTFQSKNK